MLWKVVRRQTASAAFRTGGESFHTEILSAMKVSSVSWQAMLVQLQRVKCSLRHPVAPASESSWLRCFPNLFHPLLLQRLSVHSPSKLPPRSAGSQGIPKHPARVFSLCQTCDGVAKALEVPVSQPGSERRGEAARFPETTAACHGGAACCMGRACPIAFGVGGSSAAEMDPTSGGAGSNIETKLVDPRIQACK